MKQLFFLSQFSKKAILVIFCFLLSPPALISAQAQSQGGSPNQDERSTLVNLSPENLGLETNVRKNTQIIAQAISPDGENLDTAEEGAKGRKVSKATDISEIDTKAGASNKYALEFSRSPIVGNRLRLRGVYSEARLAFTRPRNWTVGKVQAVINFQHSPALYANRSNLTVLVNDRAIGSIPLNRKDSQMGKAVLNIPANLLQPYNELKIVAQQNDSENCSDPNSPTLWTEILPDSKLVFDFQRKPVAPNFNNYPYPLFDELNLESNQIVYLEPNQINQSWLTSAARLQTSLGRLAQFRPIETKLVPNLTGLTKEQRLVIIGTPSEQPTLADLKLPLKISGNRILEAGGQSAVQEDFGVLMMALTPKTNVPVVIATGNSPKGVAKAAQMLAHPESLKKLGAGQYLIVEKIQETSVPGPRKWAGYLPEENQFQLGDLVRSNGDRYTDVTVRGSGAPSIDIDFRALPDDRFVRGSSMNLVYSYGPQINPRTSAIEVLLDGNFIGGARLHSEEGEKNKSLKVDLPANLIKPNSRLQVFFRMNPREPFNKQTCLSPPDQQLTGTVHSDTSFELKRETSVDLPDLKLLQFGYPFASPQDLSGMAIVVPQNPSQTDVLTLLAFSERLGRLSKGDSVKFEVYTPESLPKASRDGDHLVAIGTRDKIPFQQVFQTKGFNLSAAFARTQDDTKLQTPQDNEGLIKQIVSPFNGDRVVLALTGQTAAGLERVRQVLSKDPWFFQLKDDTVLISSDEKDPKAWDPEAYTLSFFDTAPTTRRVESTNLLSKSSRMLQDNWLLLPAGIVGVSLLLYGIVQLYLKRLTSR